LEKGGKGSRDETNCKDDNLRIRGRDIKRITENYN
jgi:hypothetical protein